MKELTIEQKAQRYDEAIEIAKEINNEQRAQPFNIMTKIFPELKESEDERIRKAIIYFISHTPTVPKGIIGKETMLAWLEKQGEQKPDTNCLLSWSETDEKMIQSLEGIVKDYWAKAEQEKNEIKIREASNVSYFLKTIQKSPLCWIKCSDGLPNKDGIYLVVTDGRHNDVYDMARYDSVEGWHKASEIIYWMPIPQLNNKSIIEQKPAWSEEDEVKINRIVACLENLNVADNDILLKDVDWLKSLRPQDTWKPSDEQMKALNTMNVTGCITEVGQGKSLVELYNDLKKLREE